jgi:DNA invertase Pin-like site-specific DNA recombinase
LRGGGGAPFTGDRDGEQADGAAREAVVEQIFDAKAQFRSLAEPWADTGTITGRLMIGVLGGLAYVERDLIRRRTAEGRSRAQSADSIWTGRRN